MAERSVLVRLGLDITGYQANAAKAAASTSTIGKEAEKAAAVQAAAQAKAVGEIKKLGVATAGVAVGIGFASYKAIQAASSLSETINKSNVVFGKSAAEIEKWGDTAATSMGMSKQQAIEATATLGNLFVSMKMGQAEAAKMSTSMVQLAADLASFNNTNPEDALEALRAGLVGETEPLRRYGINLNDAALKQKALAMGLEWTGQVLPPVIRTQAAYALILEQSGTAQGDFARTSDGLANQQRILSARWKDMQAQIGEGLLPVMNTLVSTGSDILGVFTALPAPVRNTATAVAVAGGAFLILAPRIIATKNALIAMGPAGATAAAGIAAVAKAAGALGIVLIAANAAGDAFRDAVGATTKEGAEAERVLLRVSAAGKITKDDFDALGGKAVDLQGALDSVFSAGLLDKMGAFGQKAGSLGGLLPWGDTMADEAQRAFASIDAGLTQMLSSGKSQQAAQVFSIITEEAKRQGIEVSRLAEVFPGYTAAVEAVGPPTSTAASAAQDLAAANKASADAAQQAADAITAQISAVMMAANADLAAMDAQDQWKASLKDSSQTLRDKEKAALNAAAAVGAAAEKDAAAAGSANAAAVGQAAMRGEFEKMRAQVAPGSPLYIYLTGLIAKLDEAAIDRTMTFTTVYKSTGTPAVGMTASTYNQQVPKQARGGATGGTVTQDGIRHYAAGGSVDTVPAMLAPGEFVLQASAAKALGLTFLQMLNDSGTTSQAAAAVGSQVGAAMTTGVAKGVSESHKKVIDEATSLFADLQGKARDMAKQVADTVAGSFNDFQIPEHGPVETWYADAMGNITKSYDAGGAGTPVENQQAKAAGMTDFAKQISQLSKAGLNNANLQDIISSGWQKGGEAAAEILSNAGSIQALNAAQSQIDAAAKAIGGVAAQSEYGKAMVSAQQQMVKILTAGVKIAGPDLAYLASIVGSAVARASVKKARGGLVHGPGSGTSDEVPILASNGEYVIRASAVKRIGVATLNRINYGKPVDQYARGGLISTTIQQTPEWRPSGGSSRDADYLAQRIGFYLGQALNGSAATRQLQVATRTGTVR